MIFYGPNMCSTVLEYNFAFMICKLQLNLLSMCGWHDFVHAMYTTHVLVGKYFLQFFYPHSRTSIQATNISCTTVALIASDPPMSGPVMVMIDSATVSDDSVQYNYTLNPEFNSLPNEYNSWVSLCKISVRYAKYIYFWQYILMHGMLIHNAS